MKIKNNIDVFCLLQTKRDTLLPLLSLMVSATYGMYLKIKKRQSSSRSVILIGEGFIL